MLKRAFLSFALLASSLLTAHAAAPAPRDLGGGLTFVRLHDLAEPVPDVSGPVIIDLRYASIAAEADPSALRGYLQAPGSLRLVLHDAAPAAGLVALLAKRDAAVLTLAPAGTLPQPDVALSVDPAADRAAYDALESGVEITTLADSSVSKQRFDEAALVRARSRRGDASPAADPAAAEPSATPTPATESAATPPIDRLLQHAVRIVRGLQALGRA